MPWLAGQPFVRGSVYRRLHVVALSIRLAKLAAEHINRLGRTAALHAFHINSWEWSVRASRLTFTAGKIMTQALM